MRYRNTIASALVSVSACLPSLPAAAREQPGILGYLDARTGIFRAASLTGDADPAAASVVSGTFNLALAIHAVTPSSAVSCSLQVTAFSATGVIEETAGASASVSGGNATCDITLPYAWRSPTASASTPIMLSFTIVGGTGQRLSSQGLASLTKVPANGSTTSYAIAATI